MRKAAGPEVGVLMAPSYKNDKQIISVIRNYHGGLPLHLGFPWPTANPKPSSLTECKFSHHSKQLHSWGPDRCIHCHRLAHGRPPATGITANSNGLTAHSFSTTNIECGRNSPVTAMLGLGRFEFQLVSTSIMFFLKSSQVVGSQNINAESFTAATPQHHCFGDHSEPCSRAQDTCRSGIYGGFPAQLGASQSWEAPTMTYIESTCEIMKSPEVHDSCCWGMYSSLTFVCNVRAAPSTFWRRCAPIWCWKPEGATFTGHCGIMPSLAPWWPGVGSSLDPLILKATVQPVPFPKSYTYNML